MTDHDRANVKSRVGNLLPAKTKVTSWIYPAVAMILLALTWEVWVLARDLPVFGLPRPSHILERMVSAPGVFLPEAAVTLRLILLGYLLAIGVGLVLAIAMVSWRPFERSIYPILVASQVVPKIAIAPLVLIWFGFTLASQLLIVFLLAFFPIVLDAVTGLRALDERKIYLARSMGASRIRMFASFRVPNALPNIFSGLKVGAVLAVTGAVIAEFIVIGDGLGRVIIRANAELDLVTAFASVGYLGLVGFLLFYAVTFMERRVISWHVSQRT